MSTPKPVSNAVSEPVSVNDSSQRGLFSIDVKEEWLNKQLQTRQAEFTDVQNIIVFCGTWNVNGKMPSEPLDLWLSNPKVRPDIYAIGFQELDLTTGALVLDNSKRGAEWETLIGSSLRSQHSAASYVPVLSKQMVGVLLSVWVREPLLEAVRDVCASVAACGLMNYMGNKGGVAVRLRLFDSSFCFVCSHLNAHSQNVLRRNQDFAEICRRISFPPLSQQLHIPSAAVASASSINAETTAIAQPNQSSTTSAMPAGTVAMLDHDHVFWFGDLNYRVNLSDLDARACVDLGDFDRLLLHDQLKEQMRQAAAFASFSEAPIRFAPTYKYDVRSTVYDTSEKRRVPSYTDRVLWQGSAIRNMTYERHELLSSDHRPVSALFEVQVKKCNPLRRREVYFEVVRELDRLENECQPDVRLSSISFQLADVRFGVPQNVSMCIENVGAVLAKWRFVPRLGTEQVCATWLSISPLSGLLLPKQKVDVTFRVFVDQRTASVLCIEPRLEDILILHLDNGKDHFISLSGQYLRSCFGCSLPALTGLVGPVRQQAGNEMPTSTPAGSLVCAAYLSVPKEIWRLVDAVCLRGGLDEPEIFLQSGLPAEVLAIREALDCGLDFSPTLSVLSIAEVLLSLLSCLPDSIVPFASYSAALEVSSSFSRSKTLIGALPRVHRNTFCYIIAFLRELLLHAAKNHLTAQKIAIVFGTVLIRNSVAVSFDLIRFEKTETEVLQRAQFVYHFLCASDLELEPLF